MALMPTREVKVEPGVPLTDEQKEQIAALVRDCTYSRARSWCRVWIITFYGADAASPSGVMAIGHCRLTDEVESLIRSLDSRKCPLSPTEGLRR